MEKEEVAEGHTGGAQPAYKERDLDDTASDVAMVNSNQSATPSFSDKSEGVAKCLREVNKEEGECTPGDIQTGEDRATSIAQPFHERKGIIC